MAKKNRKKKAGCPKPLNGLINLAAGLTMAAIADHMEDQYHYTSKGTINPYAASAVGLASGKLNSTKDLIRLGGVLGAAGSFDVDKDIVHKKQRHIAEDPIFQDIQETKTNNNRYAWRLNCEDGSQFGISPQDYETKSEYNEALKKAKSILSSK